MQYNNKKKQGLEDYSKSEIIDIAKSQFYDTDNTEERYINLDGEKEARDVEKRINYSNEQRKRVKPAVFKDDIRYSLKERENSEKKINKALQNITTSFGKSISFWKENLLDTDKDAAYRILSKEESVRNKYIIDNNIDINSYNIYEPISYLIQENNTTEIRDFIINNNLTLEKITRDEKLRN